MKRLLVLTAAAAIGVHAATPVAAQTGTTDPVLKRIWRSAWTAPAPGIWRRRSSIRSDRASPARRGHVGERLGDQEVQRVGHRRAARAVRHVARLASRVRHIDLVKPRVRSLEATMLGDSPGTAGTRRDRRRDHPADVRRQHRIREVAAEGEGQDRAASRRRIRPAAPRTNGRRMATPESKARMDTTIVKMRRRLDDENSTTRAIPSRPATRRGNLGMRLEKAGAVGVIVSNLASPTGGAWGTWTVFDTKNTTALGIAMSCEDYGLLYRLTERKQGPQLRVNAVSETLGEVPVFNTFGTIKGTEKPNEYVMLSAHFDSWDGSPGATDNGTGTIMMMEAMRILKQAYPHPKRTIMVGHWASEEQGLNGSRAFAVRSSGGREGDRRRCFNQDNGTGRVAEHVGRRPARRRRSTCRRGSPKLPQEFQNQVTLQRRRRAGDRRHRQRVVRLLRRAGVRAGLGRTGTTARTPTTPIATASTRSCSTISRGTRRSSRCSRIWRRKIRASSRAIASTSPRAAGRGGAGRRRGAPSGRGAINLGWRRSRCRRRSRRSRS